MLKKGQLSLKPLYNFSLSVCIMDSYLTTPTYRTLVIIRLKLSVLLIEHIICTNIFSTLTLKNHLIPPTMYKDNINLKHSICKYVSVYKQKDLNH